MHFIFPREVRRTGMAAALCVVSALLAAWGDTDPPVPKHTPQVVILNAYHHGDAWADGQLKGVLAGLSAAYPDSVPSVEHLDAKRHPDAAHLERLSAFLREKYREQRLDLVIALDNPALDLLLASEGALFPGVPVVFAGINGFAPEQLRGRTNITGVSEDQDMAGTLRLILALHPRTRRILAIHDDTSSGRVVRREMEAILPEFTGRVQVEFTPPASMSELEALLRELPADTVAIILSFVTDREGRTFSRAESTRRIALAAPVPVYAMHETRLGHGIVGGMLLEGEEHGRQAAEIALRVLGGEAPSAIPVARSRSRPVFDYAALQRWGIALKALPPGSIVIGRPLSFWEKSRRVALPFLTVAGVAVLWALVLLLALLRLRRAHAALQESEVRYRRLVETAGEGVCAMDEQHRITFVNRHMADMLGYTAEEMLGRRLHDFLPDEDLPKRDSGADPVAPRLGIAFEQRLRRKDGSLCWTLASATALHDAQGRCTGSFAMFNDITERKRSETALRESEARSNLAIEGGDLGTWDWDIPSGRVVFNARWARMLGCAPQEIAPEFPAWERLIHPDDLPRVRAALEEHLSGRAPSYQAELRMRHKNGSWVWVLAKGRVIERDAQGAPLRAGGTHLDITEQKRLEEQYRQAQKMEAVGRLAAGVAHDFNNQLTVVLGYCDILLSDRPLDDPLLRPLNEIHRAAERAQATTRHLLAFSRKQVLQPEKTDLNELLQAMRGPVSRMIGEDVALTLIALPRLRPLFVDKSGLQQAVMNLIVNARDAMPTGGALTLRTANLDIGPQGDVEFPGAPPGPYVLLEVKDTGVGMDADTLAHVFDPFFTTKEVGKGTGLGLPMVLGFVQQSQGFIAVRSSPGQGASFRILLPADTRAPAEERPGATAPASGGAETILVVEDEPCVRDIVVRSLEKRGYHVLQAAAPSDALALLHRHDGPLHLLVTDVVMPGMNGADLARRLQAENASLRTLFITGYTDEGLRMKLDHVLQKPFNMDTLARKIRDVLDAP